MCDSLSFILTLRNYILIDSEEWVMLPSDLVKNSELHFYSKDQWHLLFHIINFISNGFVSITVAFSVNVATELRKRKEWIVFVFKEFSFFQTPNVRIVTIVYGYNNYYSSEDSNDVIIWLALIPKFFCLTDDFCPQCPNHKCHKYSIVYKYSYILWYFLHQYIYDILWYYYILWYLNTEILAKTIYEPFVWTNCSNLNSHKLY